MQKATLWGTGKLVCHTVDDGVLAPRGLDSCIDQYYNSPHGDKSIINMRYSEGVGFSGPVKPRDIWEVKNCPEFRQLKFIKNNWRTTVQPLMSRSYFIYLGGFDCQFEYSNHCHHDFAFRAQLDDAQILHSDGAVSKADHMPRRTGDHGPVHDVQTQIDLPVFNTLWNEPREPHIKYDSWKKFDGPWERRFRKPYTNYLDMVRGEGYFNE
jgi:hypothetical protein